MSQTLSLWLVPSETDPKISYQTMVGAFRARVQRRPLPPLEKGLIWILSTLLVFSTWAIGLRELWAQQVAFGLAAIAFILALFRPGDLKSADPLARRSAVSKLLRFPIFWLGLLLMAYFACQALNPAWRYTEDLLSWYLVKVRHIEWLPSGNQTPIKQVPGTGIPHTNAWFYMLLWGTPLLAVCAGWIGITRRFSCQILAWVLVGNAAAMTLLALTQYLAKTEDIYWFYEVPGTPWGTFSYRNWAASFLGLSGAVGLGLALAYGRDRLFSARGRNPIALVALLSFVILAGATLSGSRAGFFWAIGLAVFSIIPFIALLRRSDPGMGIAVPAGLVAVLIAGFVVLLVGTLQPKDWPDSISRLFQNRDLSAQGRVVLNKESWQLTERNPWFGIGAGGYRYHFPSVQATSEHFKGVENVRHYTFVRDAHNDWLQYYIELGRIGSAIPLAMLLFWLGWFLRHRFWRSPYVLMSALGIGLACLHAGAEFIWQNGACLLLLGIVVFTAARWRECEHVAALEARTEPAAAKR